MLRRVTSHHACRFHSRTGTDFSTVPSVNKLILRLRRNMQPAGKIGVRETKCDRCERHDGARSSTRGERASRSAEKRFSARCNSNARASRSLTTVLPKLICIISACRLQRDCRAGERQTRARHRH